LPVASGTGEGDGFFDHCDDGVATICVVVGPGSV